MVHFPGIELRQKKMSYGKNYCLSSLRQKLLPREGLGIRLQIHRNGSVDHIPNLSSGSFTLCHSSRPRLLLVSAVHLGDMLRQLLVLRPAKRRQTKRLGRV